MSARRCGDAGLSDVVAILRVLTIVVLALILVPLAMSVSALATFAVIFLGLLAWLVYIQSRVAQAEGYRRERLQRDRLVAIGVLIVVVAAGCLALFWG